MATQFLPVELGDALIQGWEVSGCGDFIGRVELEFDAHLDPAILRRAVDLLIETEPLLAARLDLDGAPRWELGVKRERDAVCCVTTDLEYDAIFDRPLASSPQIEVCLQPRLEGDRLMIKVAHQVSDGSSKTELVQLLASIYTGLSEDEAYQPPKPQPSDRSLRPVLSKLSIVESLRVTMQMVVVGLCLWLTRTFRLPGAIPPLTEPWSRVRRLLERDQVAAIVAYGRARQATLNDLFIAAYVRALARIGNWDGQSQLILPMTVDLRRWYLQDDAVPRVSNYSSTELLFVGKKLGRNFEETLQRVIGLTRRLKRKLPGMLSAKMLNACKLIDLPGVDREMGDSTKPWSRPGLPPVFTNIGLVEKAALSFAGITPRMVYRWPTSVRWPGLVVGLSGYDGRLMLSARTCLSAMPMVAVILDAILSELPL